MWLLIVHPGVQKYVNDFTGLFRGFELLKSQMTHFLTPDTGARPACKIGQG